MRPIDADALTKDLTYDFTGHPLHGNMKTSMGNIRAMILAQPTIDAVPVVRCRECRYYPTAKVNEKGFLICPASGMEITETDYCSYGERMDKEDET